MTDTFRDTFIDRVCTEMKPHGSYGRWVIDAMYEAIQRAGYVILPAERYAELDKAEDTLCRLEAAGVDNWQGYSYAFEDDEDED